MKALVSMGDAWKRTFNDRVARVNPEHKKTIPNLQVVDKSAVIKKKPSCGFSQNVGTLHNTHPIWQELYINEPEWTVLMDIIKDNFSEMDCLMLQQVAQTQPRKKKGHTAVKYAGTLVDLKELQATLHMRGCVLACSGSA